MHVKEFFSRFTLDIQGGNYYKFPSSCNNLYSNTIIIVIPDINQGYGGQEKQGIFISNFLVQYYDVIIFHSDKITKKFIEDKKIDKRIKFHMYKSQLTLINSIYLNKELSSINPDCVILLFSWYSIMIWIYALRNTGIPILYSETSDPRIIEKRFKYKDRDIIMDCIDKHRVQNKCYSLNNSIILPNIVHVHDNINNILCDTKIKNILYVGRLEENKNIYKLIDLYRNKENYVLHIFGKSKIQKEDNIIFHGFKDDLNSIYMSNYYTYMYIPSEYEGCPNVVLESLSYGIPVVGLYSCYILKKLINKNNGILLDSLHIPNVIDIEYNRQYIKKAFYEKFDNNDVYGRWLIMIKNLIKKKNNTKLLKIENSINIS